MSQAGERNNAAKLSMKAVREIRARYNRALRNGTRLAREYGVTSSTIYNIVNRKKSWKQVG